MRSENLASLDRKESVVADSAARALLKEIEKDQTNGYLGAAESLAIALQPTIAELLTSEQNPTSGEN